MHRIRKVKCDEARPSCDRCTSTGRTCDGYGVWGSRSPGTPKPTNIPLAPVLVSSLITSTDEKRCFEWFRCRSAKKVQGIFVSRFWDTLVFQACTDEPAVLHATLALSSIHRIEATDNKICSPKTREAKPDSQEVFTLQQYLKAINHLHPHFSARNRASLRVALITCVLFICLEFFRGHNQTAQTHLRNGLKILDDIQSYRNNASSRSLTSNLRGDSDDDWIAVALFRLHVQVGLFNEGYRNASVVFRPLKYEPPPAKFRLILEARNHLDRLMNRIVHMTEIGYQQEHEADEMNNLELINRQRLIIADLNSWLTAYGSSKAAMLAENPVRNAFAYAILYLQYIMAKIMIHTCLWPTRDSIFDLRTEDFVSLLSVAINLRSASRSASEVLLGSTDGMSKSMADIGWIPALYYTAIKCRIHRIRLQAVKLLESTTPHREGIWDGEILSRVARKVMEIEERDFYSDVYATDDFYIGSYPEKRDFLLPALPNTHRMHEVRVLLADDPLGNTVLLCKRKEDDGSWTVIANEFDSLSQCWREVKDELVQYKH